MPELFYKKYCKLADIGDCIAGMSEEHARKYVQKMQLDPDYSHGIIRPTQKTTIIVVDVFVDFLRKMDDQKFR